MANDSKTAICEDSRKPHSVIPAQRAMDEIEGELHRFLRLAPSWPPSGPFSLITYGMLNIAPTEINNKFSTISAGPAMLTAHIGIPTTFTYGPDGMRSLHREYILSSGRFSVHIERDPTSTARGRIEDSREFRRRCPYVFINGLPTIQSKL